MSKNFYLNKSGGLGDVMWSYFYHDQDYKRSYQNLIKKIKKEEPKSNLFFISCSDNSQVKQFYETNKLIDELIVLPMSAWENGSWKIHIKNKQSLLSYGGIYKDDLSTGATKEFNLTTEEQLEYERIKNLGKFVVLHPFGGCPTRSLFHNNFDLNLLIDLICACNYNCVILGGNNNKTKNYYKQTISSKNENCINLIDAYTCRLHAALSANCDFFIGVGSCFSVTAALFNVKSFLFYPSNLKWWIEGKPPQKGVDVISQKFRENKNKIEYMEFLSKDLDYLVFDFLLS